MSPIEWHGAKKMALAQHSPAQQPGFLLRRPVFTYTAAHRERLRAPAAARSTAWQPLSEPGGISVLLLEWLRNAVQPPGSRTAVRDRQQAAACCLAGDVRHTRPSAQLALTTDWPATGETSRHQQSVSSAPEHSPAACVEYLQRGIVTPAGERRPMTGTTRAPGVHRTHGGMAHSVAQSRTQCLSHMCHCAGL